MDLLSLNNVTVSNNIADSDGNGFGDGGGIAAFGTASLKNTVIGGNADAGGEGPDCSGTFNSAGYNVIQSAAGCIIAGDATGNVVGAGPNLGSLQDNGGPTLTHALLAGSPAIDAGNPAAPGSGGSACEATDQRGIARPQGARCDIGAFESQGTEITTTVGSTLVYTDTAGNSTAIAIPAGAVTQTTTLFYATTVTPTTSSPSGFAFAGHAFALSAYQGGTPMSGFTFQQPVTVTINYSDADVAGAEESTLKLDYWTGSAWVDAATTCSPASTYTRDLAANRLSVPICHLSQFALIGVARLPLFLPLVTRGP